MDLTLEALQAIERGIKALREPTGRFITSYPLGTRTSLTYRAEGPALLEVTEDLIGAAFVVAQTYIKASKKSGAALDKIEAVANYWKHRDDWDSTWTPPPKGPRASAIKTINAVLAMGAAPPVVPGQLTNLAETALGAPFSADALWAVLAK